MTTEERTLQLARELAEAMLKDEAPEEDGFDLSSGLFGTHLSAWLRKLAGNEANAPKQTSV